MKLIFILFAICVQPDCNGYSSLMKTAKKITECKKELYHDQLIDISGK